MKHRPPPLTEALDRLRRQEIAAKAMEALSRKRMLTRDEVQRLHAMYLDEKAAKVKE